MNISAAHTISVCRFGFLFWFSLFYVSAASAEGWRYSCEPSDNSWERQLQRATGYDIEPPERWVSCKLAPQSTTGNANATFYLDNRNQNTLAYSIFFIFVDEGDLITREQLSRDHAPKTPVRIELSIDERRFILACAASRPPADKYKDSAYCTLEINKSVLQSMLGGKRASFLLQVNGSGNWAYSVSLTGFTAAQRKASVELAELAETWH